MFEDSWGLYEVRRPRKWIFHPRKRSSVMPVLGTAAMLAAIAIHYVF